MCYTYLTTLVAPSWTFLSFACPAMLRISWYMLLEEWKSSPYELQTNNSIGSVTNDSNWESLARCEGNKGAVKVSIWNQDHNTQNRFETHFHFELPWNLISRDIKLTFTRLEQVINNFKFPSDWESAREIAERQIGRNSLMKNFWKQMLCHYLDCQDDLHGWVGEILGVNRTMISVQLCLIGKDANSQRWPQRLKDEQ